MRIALVTVAYALPEATAALVESARSRRGTVEVHLFLHSTLPAVREMCEQLAEREGVTLYPYGSNRGLSRSWNEGVLAAYGAGADCVVVANDDIRFGEGDLDLVAGHAAAHRDRHLVSCAGHHAGLGHRIPSHGYSCFGLNPIALERIGCFDENIFPIYCEDQDYAYRARLAGLEETNCPYTAVTHGGSSTIRSDPDLARCNVTTHGLNQAYYRRKWGGDGGAERFLHPFDDPALDHFIPPDRRGSPYGPRYDRTGREL